MPVRHGQKIGHAFRLRPGNRDFAVIRPREESKKQTAGGMIAGKDAHRANEWPEPMGQVGYRRAQLAARRTEYPAKPTKISEIIDQLAPLIRGAEHHHPSQFGQGVCGKKRAEQDSPHGMGNKVDGADALPPQFCDRRRYNGVSQCLNRMLTRGIADVDHCKTPLP